MIIIAINNNINIENKLNNHRQMVARWQWKYERDILEKKHKDEDILIRKKFDGQYIDFTVKTACCYNNPSEAWEYLMNDKEQYIKYAGIDNPKSSALELLEIVFDKKNQIWNATYSYNTLA